MGNHLPIFISPYFLSLVLLVVSTLCGVMVVVIEMKYNGQTNLVIGHRTIRPGQTFFIDDDELANNINPNLINTGIITYVNNNGLPAGTISAQLVSMQPQVAISAGDVQTAMSQISGFMNNSSGTFTSLQGGLNTAQLDIQATNATISELQTNASNSAGQILANTNNINSINTNLAALTTTVDNDETSITNLQNVVAKQLTRELFDAGVAFASGTTSITVTHNVGNQNYAVVVTATSNVGSGTFWVDKLDNTTVVTLNNVDTLFNTVTADVVIMS